MIRNAREADVYEMLGMAEQFYTSNQFTADYDRESMRITLLHYLNSPGMFQLFCAEVDGEIGGVMCLAVAPCPWNHKALQSIQVIWIVRPELRGQGIGLALAREYIRRARALGVTHFTGHEFLPVGSKSSFWPRFGLKQTEVHYMSLGVPHGD